MNLGITITLYIISGLSLIMWCAIWVMHIIAITNAKLKLHKRSYIGTNIIDNAHTSINPKAANCNFSNRPQTTTATTTTKKTTTTTAKKVSECLACRLELSCCRCKLHNEKDYSSNIISGHSDRQHVKYLYKLNKYITKYFGSDLFQKKQQRNSRESQELNNSKQVHNLLLDDAYHISLPLPGVSIIKPLVGIDTNLYYNLETFFRMDYPLYEILFCVQVDTDAAIMIVKRLLQKYPHIDAKLFIGGAEVGVNPKINNMQPAYLTAKYDLLLVSDSGISMKPDTLLDMVSHMNDDVALVHQMPFVCDRRGFPAIVEKVYFGTAHARAYLTADVLGINCPTGMSALMRKFLLDEVGGIKSFGQYLAEDFFFAKSFTDRGWKISISSQPAWQNANSCDINTLNTRVSRWVKLRFAMVPQWTLLEPFSECMLLGLLAALSISFICNCDPFAVFLFHILLWFLLDYMLLSTIQNGPLTFSKTDFVVAWMIRESTAFLLYVKALANPEIRWRSKKFKLRWGGYAEELKTTTPIDTDNKVSNDIDTIIDCT